MVADKKGNQGGWASPRSTVSPLPGQTGVRRSSSRGNVAAAGEVGPAGRARQALRLWWPLLAGLAGGARDPRLDCRAAALSTLQDLLKDFGSAPEFSVRVWPFVLTRVLLPASRHAARPLPPPPPQLVAPSAAVTSTTKNTPPRPASANDSTPLSSKSAGAGAGGGSRRPSSANSAATAAAAAATAAFAAASSVWPVSAVTLSPANPGVLPLDVSSWVHTTAPQLFRAAVTVVTRNAETAAPLGVPTLMAFFEPHICCRHQSGHQPGTTPPVALRRATSTGDEERGDGGKGFLQSRAVAGGEGGGDGKGGDDEHGWEAEVDAAAAAGAAVAEEAGVSGDALVSRMALESVGLLVEGLVGQQVSAQVLGGLCDKLVHMLHCCLPESFGQAGRLLRAVSTTDPFALSPEKSTAGTSGPSRGVLGGLFPRIEGGSCGSDSGGGGGIGGGDSGDSGGSGGGGGGGEPAVDELELPKGDPVTGDAGGGGTCAGDGSGGDRGKNNAGADDCTKVGGVEARSHDSTGGASGTGTSGGAGGIDGANGAETGSVRPATARGGGDDGDDAGGPVTAAAAVASDDREVLDATDVATAAAAAAAVIEGSPRRGSRVLEGSPPRRAPHSASADGGGSSLGQTRPAADPLEFRAQSTPAEPLSLTKSLLEDDGEFDGKHVTAVLGAALRLQRLLFGMARLHLGRLGEGHTRAVMGGLSAGLRHARAFQAQHGLRASLLSSGLLVPRSGPGSQELPHLLDQECEGLCYIFAISFRLLGVLWPRHPRFGSTSSRGGSGMLDSGQAASSSSFSSFSLWPERGAFESEAAALDGVGAGQHHRQGSRHSQQQQQQQQQQQHQRRRLRPPRPGSATSGSGGGAMGGSRSGRNGNGIGGNVPAGPVLVVDDLLEWSGEGDEGPVGVGGGGASAVGEGGGRRHGGHGRRSSCAAEWDGTVLGREFLKNEGTALLRRYFVADGEVQRGSFEDAMWDSDEEAPFSPSHSSTSRSRPPLHDDAPSPSGASRLRRLASEGSSTHTTHSSFTGGGTGRSQRALQPPPTMVLEQGASTPTSTGRGGRGSVAMSDRRREAIGLAASQETEIRCLTPAVLLLLRGLLLLKPSEAFAREASWVYPCLADLVVVRSLEVRAAVRELLSTKMAPLLTFAPDEQDVPWGE